MATGMTPTTTPYGTGTSTPSTGQQAAQQYTQGQPSGSIDWNKVLQLNNQISQDHNAWSSANPSTQAQLASQAAQDRQQLQQLGVSPNLIVQNSNDANDQFKNIINQWNQSQGRGNVFPPSATNPTPASSNSSSRTSNSTDMSANGSLPSFSSIPELDAYAKQYWSSLAPSQQQALHAQKVAMAHAAGLNIDANGNLTDATTGQSLGYGDSLTPQVLQQLQQNDQLAGSPLSQLFPNGMSGLGSTDPAVLGLPQMLANAYGAMGDASSPFWQGDWNMANQMGQYQADVQKAQLQNLINQYQGQLSTGRQGIQDQYLAGQQQLQNQAAQDQQSALQQMAARGLVGSGLQNDTNTRLAMANAQNLSNLQLQKATQTAQLEQQMNPQIAQAESQLALTNPYSFAMQNFENLYGPAETAIGNEARYAADALGNALKYTTVSPDQALSTAATVADNTAKNALGYTQAMGYLTDASGNPITGANGQPIPTEAALNNAAMRQIQQEGIMGYDANGNPTLDTQKLQETIRNDTNNYNAKTQTLSNDLTIANINAGAKYAALKNTEAHDQATALYNAFTAGNSAVKTTQAAIAALNPNDKNYASDYAALTKTLKQQVQSVTDAQTKLNDLASQYGIPDNAGFGGTGSGTTTGGAPTGPITPSGSTATPFTNGSLQDQVAQALQMAGFPASDATQYLQLIQNESGGNPAAVNPNAINYGGGYGMENATGLTQMMPTTFQAYAVPGHDNIMNPLDNMLADLNYIKANYGGSIASALNSSLNGGY